MSSDLDDKCFVCLKAGRNLNLFTTYNMRNEKEELYVEVIKNCYNIEISPDSGITYLCNECSMKLKKAYNFRHDILEAIEKLIATQVATTNEKQYSEIEYLEDIPFEADYDIDTVLSPETGQMSYTLDEIHDNKEINENNEPSYLFHLDNDTVVDKVLLNKLNDNACEVMLNNDLNIDKADSELNLEPGEICLDKPDKNYAIDILSDILVGNDLEPGEIRIIDKTVGQYLIDSKTDVVVDKKKVIIKGKGKINAKNNDVIKTILNQEAGPVNSVEKKPVTIVTHLVDEVIDEKNKVSKSNTVKKCANRNTKKKDKTVLSQFETSDKKDLIKDKKKVNKRVVKKPIIDELSLLAQICTEQPYPEENTANTAKETNKQETKDDQTSLMDIDNDVGDKNASKENKSRKRSKKNAGKTEASVKENVSDNVDEVKVKKPRKKEKRSKPPAKPFTLHPTQTACELCPASFETPHALSMHMNSHFPQFVCGTCGTEVATKNRLRQHLRTHEEGPFTCKICDKEFSNSNTRNAHTWRVHSKGDPFKCRHCSLRFPTFLQRLRHVQGAHGETPEYVCQFCEAKFAYAAYRTKHIRTMHLDERLHPCPRCPAAFARARSLAAHRAARHGEGRRPHRCAVCGASFYFRSDLRYHASRHRQQFPCTRCSQRFATSSELDSHMQIHEHADNMALSLDFGTSLQLDPLADDYALMDPSYLDLNEIR